MYVWFYMSNGISNAQRAITNPVDTIAVLDSQQFLPRKWQNLCETAGFYKMT